MSPKRDPLSPDRDATQEEILAINRDFIGITITLGELAIRFGTEEVEGDAVLSELEGWHAKAVSQYQIDLETARRHANTIEMIVAANGLLRCLPKASLNENEVARISKDAEIALKSATLSEIGSGVDELYDVSKLSLANLMPVGVREHRGRGHRTVVKRIIPAISSRRVDSQHRG